MAEIEGAEVSRFPDGPADSPGFLLWHLTLAWQRAIAEALAPLALTHVQFVLLACAWWLDQQGRTPNQLELARQAGTDVKMTSQVVRRLEAKGLIDRTVDPSDTRARRLRPTGDGARLARRAIRTVEAVDARFFGGETDHLTPMLQRLTSGQDARDENDLRRSARDARRSMKDGLAAAKDLSTEAPRGLGAELEGYAWLPRMLDKARATLAGTAGPYQFGCPVDHTCLARLGVEAGLVLDLAARHADDHAVLQALREHGIPSAPEAWFDGQAVEDELQDTGHYLRVRHRTALTRGEAGDVFSGEEHGAGVSIALIEAPPGEAQEAHTHPVEEVVVVQQGAARFSLGERQQRIVRTGEIARVPAGVPHRWVAEPGELLRMVAVYGAPQIVTRVA